ncbi:MAG: hypothetical protein BGP05_15850 [Rhizobiales bacterium 62-47]|nr:hypothetical protein [Hyphomicrobiales bacterium]OJY13542.1 MAG: hypothetical protein BGP05_15850 [Rhizobiales bacterium 62-47]
MQARVRKFAHVLERTGLAMAGAASGLFVAAHVGSIVTAFTSQGFIILMMLAGAIGFYLGIDTPQQELPGEGHLFKKIDTAEFLSAVGTFFAALTAFAAVSVIVFREDLHIFWTYAMMVGWVVGVAMQIIAGAIARIRA